MAVETFKEDLKKVLESVEKEKGISRALLVDAIKEAVLTAAKKKLSPRFELESRFNEEKGEVEIFRWLRVVDLVRDPFREISLEEARQRLDPTCNLDDELGEKLDTSDLGRIPAQAAKQVIIQRVRKAERDLIYDEYKDRRGEIVTGTLRRFERQDMILDLGRAEAVLPRGEQISKESTYRIGDRVQAYIKDVRNDEKSPTLLTVSRADEGFLIKLFEMEVPEIFEGIVKIISAARDPGVRAKIAVTSRDHDVDPVGACVGVKGARVQAVVQELRGEKIDIVPYSEDAARFVCNSIAPAQVSRVIIDEDKHSMELIVPDDQLSLAIGRKGQNVRLATKLTGWNIEIVSEKDVQEEKEKTYQWMAEIGQIPKEMMDALFKLGYRSLREIMRSDLTDLAIIPGIGLEHAEKIQQAAAKAWQMREAEQRQARKDSKDLKDAKARRSDGPAPATAPPPAPSEGEE